MEDSENVAWDHLSAEDSLLIEELSPWERNRWFIERAIAFIRAQPPRASEGGRRKIGIGFSILLSPRSSFLSQTVYAASYGLIAVLAAIGIFQYRRDWRNHVLFYLSLLTFTATTAVFWAHTRDRVYLDVYLLVFASATLLRGYDRFFGRRASTQCYATATGTEPVTRRSIDPI